MQATCGTLRFRLEQTPYSHVASNVRYVTHLGVQAPHIFDLSSYVLSHGGKDVGQSFSGLLEGLADHPLHEDVHLRADGDAQFALVGAHGQ